MAIQYQQEPLSNQISKTIDSGFQKYDIESTGQNGLKDRIAFCAYDQTTNELVSALVVRIFWGALHIKKLWTHKDYRHQGIASQLMQQAIDYGVSQKAPFAFVETMSFQAPEFYQKFGFEIEFERKGFDQGQLFIYMKKDLK